MSTTPLRAEVARPTSAQFHALSPQMQADYLRHDTAGHSYAWGRLDQGHPPIVTLDAKKNPAPSATDTAWAFGALYALMLLELNDPKHPRSSAFSLPSAWDEFVKTGCPEGRLPERLS